MVPKTLIQTTGSRRNLPPYLCKHVITTSSLEVNKGSQTSTFHGTIVEQTLVLLPTLLVKERADPMYPKSCRDN